ncbi:hypothetical protein QLS71_014160 [Mariniflexile litorale]|uniref:Uncharacterized protein n=1 Tax=Mariniflexile litorale TaxID=3045158 RepID=A0AAU7ED07_9FLAO|nr:hypothetical protein [Mariniflexile sp. KMM 9835]MDQ8212932.1 hypothetical protein [Mariniflexile sp. KMM 9835]
MKNLMCLFFIFLILTVTQSCETDIPVTDDTPPAFTFRVTGDGFEHVFNQDTDYSNIQLNLKHDAEYDFILSGSDAGGVKLIQWQLPGDDFIEFETAVQSPWAVTNPTISTKVIEWEGNYNNPLTGNILAGTFESNGENISMSFRFLISDFGGESGISNTTSKELTLYIGEHDTEIISL